MAMTLRLSEEAERRLEELSESTGLSKTAVVEAAVKEWDEHARHRAIVRAAAERVRARDTELLELLSR